MAACEAGSALVGKAIVDTAVVGAGGTIQATQAEYNDCLNAKRNFDAIQREASNREDWNNPIFDQNPPDCKPPLQPGFTSIREPGSPVSRGLENLQSFLNNNGDKIARYAPQTLQTIANIRARLGI